MRNAGELDLLKGWVGQVFTEFQRGSQRTRICMVPGRSPGGAYGDMVGMTSRPFDHGLAQGGFLPPSCIMQQEQSRIGEKKENTSMEGELQHCLSEEGGGLPNHREKSVGGLQLSPPLFSSFSKATQTSGLDPRDLLTRTLTLCTSPGRVNSLPARFIPRHCTA